jgi:hypothetical protein
MTLWLITINNTVTPAVTMANQGSVVLSSGGTMSGVLNVGSGVILGNNTISASTIKLGTVGLATNTSATLASGFASSGTPDVISHANGTVLFTDTVGTGTIGTSASFTFNSASYENECGANGRDMTNPSIVLRQTGGPSTTNVTMTSYSITTGLASAPAAGDVLQIGPCFQH